MSLEAGELVGQRTHVAAALHVVLPPERNEPGSPATDVAGQQREIAQRQHVVDGVVVFGDAEGPEDLALLHRGVGMGHLADRRGGDAGDLGGDLERVRLDGRRELVVARVAWAMNSSFVETGMDDLAGDRIRQCDVGADVDPEPQVGELRRRRAPRVDAVHPAPLSSPCIR